MIDLRSATVTRPTPAMREAEAALLVPTGTMGNLCAVFAQTGRGDEVMVESGAHIYRTEQGGMAALAGVPYRVLLGERGMIPIALLRAELASSSYASPLRTAPVCVETTHMGRAGLSRRSTTSPPCRKPPFGMVQPCTWTGRGYLQ